MSHDGSSCKSYIKHPTEKERLDNLAFTTFPEDYLPYTSSYHRKAPYLVWDDGFRPHRKRRLKRWRQSPACRCCTTAALVTAISVIIVGILSIVAVSIYLGVVTNFFRSPILSLSGKISVIDGDEFSDNLLNTSSYQFLSKAEIYQAMLENVYLSSSLESAFVGAKVYAFRKGGLLVFFRIYLDRRKLLQSDKDILVIAKNIITDEATANKKNFNNLNIDPFSVEFREYEDEQWLSASEFEFQKQTTIGGSHDEDNINSLFISHIHEKEYSSYTSTSVNEISQPIYTKDFQADKEAESYVTPINKGTGMLDNSVPTDNIHNVSSVESGIEYIETINIGERTYSQWQPINPIKRPVTEVTVGVQLPHRGSQNPGKGSVHLLEDVPINRHLFPVLRIPSTDETHDLNSQSVVASSIMSSVSLVILPSTKNRTVTLNNKSRLDRNTIATVVKPEVTEVNSSSNDNDSNPNTGKLNFDATSLVNDTAEERLDIRRDHASLRFIDHQLDKIKGQHIYGDGIFPTDINREKNFTLSLSGTTVHSVLLPSEVIESDKSIKLVPSQDHGNQSLNRTYIDKHIRTSDLVESYGTDSVTMTNNPTLSPEYTHEPPSFPEIIIKNKHEIKSFHTEKESISTSQNSSEKFESERLYSHSKSEVGDFQNITSIKLNTDSLNENATLHFQSEIFTLVEPLSGDFNLGIDGNSEESSHINESSVFSKGNNSLHDLHDLPVTSVNLTSIVMDEFQTRPPLELEFYPEVTTTFTNSGNLTTFPFKLVKETTLKYADVSSVNHDEVTTGDFTTVSYIRTEELLTQENFTGSEKLEYKDNASNISDSLMIASEQNSSIGDNLVGLPKIVPPFSDTQFNPNDINSESEIKNDDSFLDEGKLLPATPLSVLNIVALTLNPTAEAPEDFTNLPDDENVVLHHITTPQQISKNDSLVASLGKHPTYLFGRCLEDEIPCHSGECVPANYRCNMRRDCRDNSDEELCSCSERLKVIGQSQKICDGVQDCRDLSDEENCPWCSSGQFICPQSKFCVNMTQVCDGINDCPYGTDEKYCVKLAEDEINARSSEYKTKGYLMVRKQGQWGKLCLENLSNLAHTDTLKWKIEELGKAVCTALTYKEFKEAKQVEDLGKKNQSYYEISAEIVNRQNRRSNAIFHPSECQSKDVVHVTCKSLECGMRPMAFSLRQRIVGGQSTMSGSWPWQVALYKEGDFQCGAVLVSDTWLISAGHCFYSTQTSHWTARLGLLRRGTELPSPSEQVRRITLIFLHPEYVDKGFINDIALLRLESPVPFSDYLRPLCLPNATEDVSLWNSQQCSVIGWGKLFEIGNTFPDSLQEVRLPVISTEECRKKILFLSMYHITDNMFCAGYERGGRDACLGDSGGPLMCQRSDGRWVLLGVTSNGDGCGRPGRPGVYTKVTKYLNWIQQTMDSELPPVRSTICHGHRCPLGRCVPEQKVCDGRWDCSDGSDEIRCLVK